MDAGAVQSQQPKLETGVNNEPHSDINTSLLHFLTDDLVFGSEALDPATLEAVCQVSENSQGQASGAPAVRPLLASRPSAQHLSGLASKRMFEEVGSESEDDEESGKGDKASNKKSKGGEVSAAATKKACREKARREKLNERFSDLARLVDPNGEPKTDKNTILTDAIKYVQQITVENHQLRQLNKFLEERVSALERERGQQLYQQSLMMTSVGQGQLMQAGQPMLVGGLTGLMGNAMAGTSMGHPQVSLQGPGGMASSSGGLLSAASLPSGHTPPLPPLHSQAHQQPHAHQQQAMPAGMLAHHHQQHHLQPQGGMLAQGQGGMMVQGQGGMMAQQGQGGMMALQMQMHGPMQGVGVGVPGVGPLCSATAPGVTVNVGAVAGPSKPFVVNAVPGSMPYQGAYWLPPQMMDSTQDSLLRPPAA